MNEIKDGGAAFPHGEVINNSLIYEGECGMSLRDWFAGQALAGTLPGAMLNPEDYARLAYRMADAMLAIRG